MPRPEPDDEVPRLLASIRARAAAQRAVTADPATIGPYRVLRRLGQGGMGAVFLAEAPAPLERRVAIKLVRPGYDGDTMLVRFRREQRAIARLEHEHIARVFDAGTTDDGRPFLVMEHVDGQPIDVCCRERSVTLPGRLALFLQTCAAVEHAHLRGFIHRDLKPGNVLVCERDGRLTVKVIDFGLAAIDDDTLADDWPRTLPGQVLGTPGYMSPEQASASTSVDLRSDVYALGVTLHELITGARPTRTPSAPLRPSATLAALSTAAAAAAQREFGVEPRWLLRQVRGDLDWIVEKATAIAVGERYHSVHALAEDIGRVLRAEPLPHRPSGICYRLRRRAAQNRLAAALALAGLLALALGATGTIVGLVEARANLTLFEHLASVEMMRRAHADEVALYPPVPARIAAMRRWLDRYRSETQRRVERLEDAMAALRRRAIDDPEDVRQRDREQSPAWQRQQKWRDYIAETESLLARAEDPERRRMMTAKIADAKAAIAELDPQVDAFRIYRFESNEDAFLFGALTPTLEQTQAFAATTIPRVERALAWAQELERGHDDAVRARWSAVQARLAAAPRYRGLTLVPQLDLVPLGPDPDSGLEEFAHLRSGRVPARDPSTGRLPVDDDTALLFVLLPGGEVRWGAQATDPTAPLYDPFAVSGESNARVGLLDPFLLSKHEMTRGQWLRLYGSDPSHWQTGRTYRPQIDRPITASHPVENIDWPTAMEHLAHEGLDLPTEVQWEYACRAGSDSPWSTGCEPMGLLGHANLIERDGWADDWALHAPVGSYRPNAFGLFDMHGNVREWCRDRYGNYRGCTGRGDLSQTDVDAGEHRVSRGGCYAEGVREARSGARESTPPGLKGFTLGVRPIRRIDRGPAEGVADLVAPARR